MTTFSTTANVADHLLPDDTDLASLHKTVGAAAPPRVLVLTPEQARLNEILAWPWDRVVTPDQAGSAPLPEPAPAQREGNPEQAAQHLTATALWQKPAEIQESLAREIERFPDEEPRFRTALAKADALRPTWNAMVRAIERGADASAEIGDILAVAPYLAGQIRRRQSKALARASRPTPPSRSELRESDVEHRLHHLPPSPSWRFLIDETGTRFAHGDDGDREGRMVLIAIPEGVDLPEIKGFHASEAGADAIDRVVQTLIDAPVGILGLTVDDALLDDHASWGVAIETLLEVALRVLPIDGPTTVRALIERRGVTDPRTDWTPFTDSLLRTLNRSETRLRGLTFSAQSVEKSHGLIGYADAIAFTWGSTARVSRDRLARSRLLGRCLHPTSLSNERDLFDRLLRPGPFDADAWSRLLAIRDQEPDGWLDGLENNVNARLTRNDLAWHAALAHTSAHLDGDRLDVYRADRELRAIDLTRGERSLTPRAALVWRIARFAIANHHGAIDTHPMRALRDEAMAFAAEDVRLMALALLHLAVRHTNRFDFAAAEAEMAPLARLDIQTLGLRAWGRVRSTIGQHRAFVGDLAGARHAFQDAWQAFQRLSDPAERQRESGQTDTYLCLATIDDPSIDNDVVRRRLAGHFGEDLAAAATAWAGREPTDHPYLHHLLLRYLVARGTEDERGAYLSQLRGWKSGDAHPWPLIDAARACILPQRDGVSGLQHCLDASPPTIGARAYIHAALQAACVAAGGSWPDAADDLASLAPDFPAARLDQLRSVAESRAPLVDAIAALLPFNFR